MNFQALSELAKTIRVLSAQGVEAANSGHPGMPMGAADYAAVLWSEFLNVNPDDTEWPNRDRFILSAGHGSMLLYSLLHLFGFDLPMSELQNFRQWHSRTPGHPEFGETPGVETTTGPLGQGFANGVGVALSSKLLSQRYGADLFSHKVYGIVSDGDLMEGVASEAGSLAGHLALGNIVYIYDDNEISIGGSTDICFTEDVPKRFESYGWQILDIDGHDLQATAEALREGVSEEERPTLIVAHTMIGQGSPNKINTSGVHGAPLGDEELSNTLQNLGWEHEEKFYVPESVAKHCADRVAAKKEVYTAWQDKFSEWREGNSELAAKLDAQIQRELPAALKEELVAELGSVAKDATRNLSGKAIQVVSKHLPGFIGGSADLEPSNKTLINSSSDIQADQFEGVNIRFGVREHAMGSAVNGLAYTRSWIPFGATFLVFSDYLRPAIRLAALSKLQSLFIFTHDSFWVGEDGPTHQPIEHLQSLRIIPNLYVFRPADGLEVAMCYWGALQLKESPSAMLFTRQGVSPLERHSDFVNEDILKGGYLVEGGDVDDLVIVASGSEVELGQGAIKDLAGAGIKARLVSVPCLELFLDQDDAYQESLIPKDARKVVIEAGLRTGWEQVVGNDALFITRDDYGASAPGGLLAEKFGFTVGSVVEQIKGW